MKTRTRGLLIFLATTFLLIAPLAAQTPTDTTATDTTLTETSMTDATVTETTSTDQTTTEETTTYYEGDGDSPNDAEGAMACAACGGVGLIFIILPLALSIGIAWWIYRDANRRGNPQAVLWAVLGFFFNIIGLIIYLVARPTGPIPPSSVPPASPPPPTV